MNTVVFVLTSFHRYYDRLEEQWQYYTVVAGIFLKPSEALEAARSITPLESGFDMSNIDEWEYTVNEHLADGIEPLPEHKEQTGILEWAIEPIRIGELALRYRNPDKNHCASEGIEV